MSPIILFDFDGVIITQRALEHTALILSRDKWYQWQNTSELRLIDYARLFEESDASGKRKSMIQLYKNYKPFIPNRIKRLIFFNRFNKLYQKLEQEYDELNPGLDDIIKRLKNLNVPLGIVSNTSRKRIQYFKKKLDLDKYFSIFIAREDSKRFKKPHPYPILFALVKLKRIFNLKSVNKQEVFFIGDLPSDIYSARAAGVKSIALLSGHGKKGDLEKANPSFIIKSMKELKNIDPFKKFLLD